LYSLVIGVLVVVALGLFVLAMEMADRTQGVYTRDTAEYQAAIAERIKPVGDVYLPGDEAAASPALAVVEEPEPVATAMTGPQVYNSACNACHGSGAGGAPVTGNAEAWAPRIAKGIDVLYDHAINGFDGDAVTPMLAKGGRADLSDDEVRSAVDYMVNESQ
jgi:cytochrome c5